MSAPLGQLDQKLRNSLRLEPQTESSPHRHRSMSVDSSKNLMVPSSSSGERRHSSGSNDRFIPNRSTTDLEYATHTMANQRSTSSNSLSEGEKNSEGAGQRILSFKSSAPEPQSSHVNSLKVLYSSCGSSTTKQAAESKTRYIPKRPIKILDAPNLSNDFYVRVMDWSSDNILSVIFTSRVLLWNANTMSVDHLTEHPQDLEYTCLSWEGKYLALADYEGVVYLWDGDTKKCIRRLSGHSNRVGAMGWSSYNLASGSRSGEILLHDVRIKNHIVHTLVEHTQEVCGIDWNAEGKFLASGGNDNTVNIWDIRNIGRPCQVFTQHQSAIKAIKWCPWSNAMLATGGGTSDRSLKVWNTISGVCVKSIDTGSQISSVLWNTEYKELITGQGFSSNQLSIWKYPSFVKVKDLIGHTSRIICLAMNPDSSVVASAAGDENICIWVVWPPKEKSKKSSTKAPSNTTLFQKIR